MAKTKTKGQKSPYSGKLYAVLYREGSKKWVDKVALVKRVARLTGKSIKKVSWALAVISSPSHPSNRNRSTVLHGPKIRFAPAPPKRKLQVVTKAVKDKVKHEQPQPVTQPAEQPAPVQATVSVPIPAATPEPVETPKT